MGKNLPNGSAASESLRQHKLIKPYTPRHNGKVERSHRKYNYFPMRPLNWNSPAHYVMAFLTYGEVF